MPGGQGGAALVEEVGGGGEGCAVEGGAGQPRVNRLHNRFVNLVNPGNWKRNIIILY